MSPSRQRTLRRIDGARLAALEALARENGTSVATEVKTAFAARLAARRDGTPQPRAEHPAKTHSTFWVDDDTWDGLSELAGEEEVTVTDEALAAIDVHVAGRQGKPSLRDVPRKPGKRAPKPASRDEPGETPPGMCPPHPPARVHKGFCGACAHPV